MLYSPLWPPLQLTDVFYCLFYHICAKKFFKAKDIALFLFLLCFLLSIFIVQFLTNSLCKFWQSFLDFIIYSPKLSGLFLIFSNSVTQNSFLLIFPLLPISPSTLTSSLFILVYISSKLLPCISFNNSLS